jgi:hypothetical protein
MTRLEKIIGAAFAMLAMANATAYEFENAVPLKIETLANGAALSDISIQLNGKQVEIHAAIQNESLKPAKMGFIAYTPFSRQLGEGEENGDKRFSDLRASLDDHPAKLKAWRRRSSPGFDLLTYSWAAAIPPSSTGKLAIRYQALPQFSLEQVSGERFARLVRQHCGDSAAIAGQLKAIDPAIEYVLMERYLIPVSFIDRLAVQLKVLQPDTNWIGAHPRLSLVCGLAEKNEEAFPRSGVIEDADADLSILIVSQLASP